MSRLGKLPVTLPTGVTADIKDNNIIVKGPKGELSQALHELVDIKVEEGAVTVSVKNPEIKKEKAFWGLYRSLINNMVTGVTEGFSKELEVVGVGYRVALSGKKLTLNVGFSHPVEFPLPDGVEASVEGNKISLSSIDKQLVGETAAQIRKVRKPEPYKGKGIKYVDEQIIRKEGKTAAKGE